MGVELRALACPSLCRFAPIFLHIHNTECGALGRDAWWHAFLGGSLTCLALAFEDPQRSVELTLYCAQQG